MDIATEFIDDVIRAEHGRTEDDLAFLKSICSQPGYIKSDQTLPGFGTPGSGYHQKKTPA